MRKHNKLWGENEIQYMRDNAKKFTAEYVALRLKRTPSSVRTKASALGIKFTNGRRWERHESKFLEYHYKTMKPAEIAAALKRTVPEVRSKAAHLGIKFGFWNKVSDHEVALCKALYKEGVCMEEIAEKMEIEYGTVKSYIYGWRRKNVTALAG